MVGGKDNVGGVLKMTSYSGFYFSFFILHCVLFLKKCCRRNKILRKGQQSSKSKTLRKKKYTKKRKTLLVRAEHKNTPRGASQKGRMAGMVKDRRGSCECH